MLRLATASVVAALLVALSLGTAPVGAGSGPGTQVNIVKVVVGAAPAGAEFAVAIDCEVANDDETLLFPATGGSQSTNTGTFNQSCTIDETNNGGASSVSYECEVIDVGGGLAPHIPTSCETDTSFVTGLNGEITFTVTNTFPEPEEPEPQPAAADVVRAEPAFTG